MFISAVWSGMAASTTHLILARLLGGIGCGLATTACPLYISEVSPENHRGRMVTLYHFTVCFGIVICVFVNRAIFLFATANAESETLLPFFKWFAVDQNWRAMLVSEAFPGLLFLICTFLLPDPKKHAPLARNTNPPLQSPYILVACDKSQYGLVQHCFIHHPA